MRGRRPYPKDKVGAAPVADTIALWVMEEYVKGGGRDFREVLPMVLRQLRSVALSDDYGTYNLTRTESRIEYLWRKRGASRRIKRGNRRGTVVDSDG